MEVFKMHTENAPTNDLDVMTPLTLIKRERRMARILWLETFYKKQRLSCKKLFIVIQGNFYKKPWLSNGQKFKKLKYRIFLRCKHKTPLSEKCSFISRVSSAIKHFCDKQINWKPMCIQMRLTNGLKHHSDRITVADMAIREYIESFQYCQFQNFKKLSVLDQFQILSENLKNTLSGHSKNAEIFNAVKIWVPC